MNVSNLYYLLSLGAVVASFAFNGKRGYRNAVEKQLSTLAEAQGKRIELLEKHNDELQEIIRRQTERIDYLEEVLEIRGHPTGVVQAPARPRK